MPPPDAAPPPLLPPGLPAAPPQVEAVEDLGQTRALFWQNVVREMLLTFPALVAHHPEVADGRIGALTRAGERIPLADVQPMFPCSIVSPQGMALCMAVQATVFALRTPSGEVFTLPVEEIRGLHTMSDELLRAMEDEARAAGGDSGDGLEPFGFAAFTSLARQRRRGEEGLAPGI